VNRYNNGNGIKIVINDENENEEDSFDDTSRV
jgi:hypothetical protein